MSLKQLKLIAVSECNYITLKQMGFAGDSFNDVITDLLRQIRNTSSHLPKHKVPPQTVGTITAAESSLSNKGDSS
jgi:hypothetical protein